MQAKAVSKRIGKVRIIEMCGDLVGNMAARCLTEVDNPMDCSNNSRCLIINALRVSAFDEIAAQTLLHQSKKVEKSVLITQNPFMVERLFQNDPNHQMMIFERESDAVFYLSKELSDEEGIEHRIYPRLKVALPVHVHYLNQERKKISIFCIAVNLAQKGMFALLMDDLSEAQLKRSFDIFDLPMMEFVARFSQDSHIRLQGKIVYFDAKQSGFGAEFYQLTDEDRLQLENFLKWQAS